MMVLRTEVARLPTHLSLQILLRPELTQAVPILSPLQGQPRLQTCLENLLLGAGQLEPYQWNNIVRDPAGPSTGHKTPMSRGFQNQDCA